MRKRLKNENENTQNENESLTKILQNFIWRLVEMAMLRYYHVRVITFYRDYSHMLQIGVLTHTDPDKYLQK